LCYKPSIVPCSLQEVLMPWSINRRRLSQPTLFHPPYRHPSLQAFPPEIQEKTISVLAALLRVHVGRVVVAADGAEEARDE
jgi:hypothetical protein